ncbi:MAG: ABC transporter ATP-binding protein [Armatimonadaceae bacterium]
MTLSHTAIECQNLTCRYGKRLAVDALNLSVASGEFFGFLGPNGAGKSTTIQMLKGFLRPTDGDVRVVGYDVVQDPVGVKAVMGIVAEDGALYEQLTAAEYLEFAGTMQGLSLAETRRRATDLLERLSLTAAANRVIADYSLGMKKKTALAGALIHAPQVLFLDEPFNGVDPFSVQVITDILTELTRTQGVTVFYTSHVLESMERLCNRIAVLCEGKLRAVGTVAELAVQAGAEPGTPLEMVYRTLVGEGQRIATAPDWWGVPKA